MFNLSAFHDVFTTGALPYDHKLQQEIEAHRKHADGVLFIDRVMKVLGIQKTKLYPPKTETTLRHLHQQVCDAPISAHHKLSLLYYVLLDFDDLDNSIHVSENFANLSGMPANYQLFMKGLWYMDKREYSKALEYVAHPSLIPDLADDILTRLVKQALPTNDFALPLSYFYAVQPILRSPLALDLLFEAMTRTDAAEALLYARTHAPHTREQLFRRWVSLLLDDKHGGTVSSASQLAVLPLDAQEEAWFEEYVGEGEGSKLAKAQDTLLMRRIARGQFHDVGGNSGSTSQSPWVLDALARGAALRDESDEVSKGGRGDGASLGVGTEEWKGKKT